MTICIFSTNPSIYSAQVKMFSWCIIVCSCITFSSLSDCTCSWSFVDLVILYLCLFLDCEMHSELHHIYSMNKITAIVSSVLGISNVHFHHNIPWNNLVWCMWNTHDIFQRQAGDINVSLNHVSSYFGSSHHLSKSMSRHLTVIKLIKD